MSNTVFSAIGIGLLSLGRSRSKCLPKLDDPYEFGRFRGPEFGNGIPELDIRSQLRHLAVDLDLREPAHSR